MNIPQQIEKIRGLDINEAMMDEAIREVKGFQEIKELEELKKHKKKYIRYLEAKIQKLEEE